VLLSTPLHASSNVTVSVQLANKRGFTKKINKMHSILGVNRHDVNKRTSEIEGYYMKIKRQEGLYLGPTISRSKVSATTECSCLRLHA
jgi:hypothetical protein